MQQNLRRKPTQPHFQPFQPNMIEHFPAGIKAVVTLPIALYEPGQIEVQAECWRAQLHELNCQTTLLPGQPVLVVGQERRTLIVIPLHCLLWDRFFEEFSLFTSDREIEAMHRYESNWRNS